MLRIAYKAKYRFWLAETHSVGDWWRNLSSCSNAAPVIILPKKTFTMTNK